MNIKDLQEESLWMTHTWHQFLAKDDFETPRDQAKDSPVKTFEESSCFSPPTTKQIVEVRPEWGYLSNSMQLKGEGVKPKPEDKQPKASVFARADSQPKFENKQLVDAVSKDNKNLNIEVMSAQGEGQALQNQLSMLANNVEALNLENESLRRLVRQNSGTQNSRANSKMRKLASMEQEMKERSPTGLTDTDIFQIVMVQAKALEKCIDTL